MTTKNNFLQLRPRLTPCAINSGKGLQHPQSSEHAFVVASIRLTALRFAHTGTPNHRLSSPLFCLRPTVRLCFLLASCNAFSFNVLYLEKGIEPYRQAKRTQSAADDRGKRQDDAGARNVSRKVSEGNSIESARVWVKLPESHDNITAHIWYTSMMYAC